MALLFLFAAIAGEYGPGWQVLAWIVLILVVVGLIRWAYIKNQHQESRREAYIKKQHQESRREAYIKKQHQESRREAYIKNQHQESTQPGSTEATGDSENYGWGGGNFTSDSEQPLSTVEAAAVDPQAISRPDIFEDLQQLARLRDAGIITNEEFEAKKRELLDRL
jgi:uncharacterized membrane protein